MLGPDRDKYNMLTDQLGDQLIEIIKKAPPFVGIRMGHQWDDTGKIAVIRIEFVTEMTEEILEELRQR